MNLNELAHSINSRCNFVPSLVRKETDPPRFYIFLHIPKCGGIDFEFSFKNALIQHSKTHEMPSYAARADNETDFVPVLNTLNEAYERGVDIKKISILLATHLGTNRILHEESRIPFDHPITILRDPVDRIISSYCYNCMRENQAPNLDNLESFIALPENINQITVLLEPQKNSSVEALESYVRQKFFACVDISQSNFLLGEMLSRWNLPNVLKENLNQTLAQFKIKKQDLPDRIMSTINELNAKDVDFYNRVKASPIMPDRLLTGKLNPQTLLVSDEQTQEKNRCGVCLLPTNPILEFLQKNSKQLPDRLGIIIQGINQNNPQPQHPTA